MRLVCSLSKATHLYPAHTYPGTRTGTDISDDKPPNSSAVSRPNHRHKHKYKHAHQGSPSHRRRLAEVYCAFVHCDCDRDSSNSTNKHQYCKPSRGLTTTVRCYIISRLTSLGASLYRCRGHPPPRSHPAFGLRCYLGSIESIAS